jgi:hypothetical protein
MFAGGESSMIRPFTCVCFLLACGSGLYLYQAKHRVQMIDREIEKTVRATEALREQTRVLHAEWTLQNDPQRLQALADQFLSLKTVAPGQFTNLAELGSRLPAVPAEPPPPPPPLEVPVAEQPEPPPAATVAAVAVPRPPPRPAPVVAAVAPPPRPPERNLAEHAPPEHKPPSRPVVAEVQPAHPAPAPAVRPVLASVQSTPRPIVSVSAPVPAAVSQPAALVGSALGMARSVSLPPPRPVPVSSSQWVNGSQGGGG